MPHAQAAPHEQHYNSNVRSILQMIQFRRKMPERPWLVNGGWLFVIRAVRQRLLELESGRTAHAGQNAFTIDDPRPTIHVFTKNSHQRPALASWHLAVLLPQSK